jgi:hypothetical protein
MNVKIVEIVTRSAQGITRPFICRGDDGWLYFVKGKGAGNRALISEWTAGHLGKRLGLPIPDFKQATIPPELIRLSARDDIAELGSGTGFASQMIENTDFRLQSSGMEPRVSPAEPNPHEGDSYKPQGMVASNAI